MGIVTAEIVPGTAVAREEEWDEDRINSSLTLLQEIHIQVVFFMHIDLPAAKSPFI